MVVSDGRVGASSTSASPPAATVPWSLRVTAAAGLFCGLYLLMAGPKSAIAIFPAMLFLLGAVGLYLRRRSGAVAMMLVIIPGLLMFGDGVVDPVSRREFFSTLIMLVVFVYMFGAILYHWRHLEPFFGSKKRRE